MMCYHDAVCFPVSACNRPILRTQIKSLRASPSENYFSIKDFAKLKHLCRARVPQVGSNSGDMPSHWPLSFNAPPSVSLRDPFAVLHALLCFPRALALLCRVRLYPLAWPAQA